MRPFAADNLRYTPTIKAYRRTLHAINDDVSEGAGTRAHAPACVLPKYDGSTGSVRNSAFREGRVLWNGICVSRRCWSR